MHKHSISGFICWLLGFLVTHTYAQTEVDPVTAVTLWQFGVGRLLGGESTLPLIPIGTAPGGVETTYLYQALSQVVVTATNDDGFLSVVGTRVTTIPRTVIASASGWFEPFADEPTQTGRTIACNLVNSGFGDCVDIIGASTTTSNSGLPTPLVLQVSLTVPPTVTPTNSSAPTVTPSSTALTVPPTPVNVVSTGPPTPTSSAFSTPTVTSTTKLSSATSGPLVAGVVVGGFAVVGTIVALCVFRRRRRGRLGKVEDGIATTGASAPWSLDAATHIQVKGIHTREPFAPQPLRAVPSWGKSSIGATQWSSDTDMPLSASTDSYSE
ncbi:hypothetical protein GGX14DRAFT_595175 [Mycena pura]|uniref:Mid2 domain-containing protein n=1 Tax=Mycena pura TaxID=153505 RepID=A0AAD6VS32_9AGAR|nr:hypothetical protein GGX14DRAFT_595175 [Mycena pura]